MTELHLDFHPAAARLNFGSAQRVPTGTTDYEELQNLPEINGEEVIGKKSAAAYGLATLADIPTDNAELENGAAYVTASEAAAAAPVQSVNGHTGEVELDAEDVGALPSTTTLDNLPDGTTYKRATGAQLQQISTNAAAIQTQVGEIDALQADVDAIEGKIPAQASASNQLADKDFVNSSINSSAAYFRGAFATHAALMAVQWQTSDPAAENYVSNNDYAYVADDETHDDEAWRYSYVLQPGGQDNGWKPQFRVNESPLTAAQLAALNSGATAEIIASVGNKLDKTGDGSNLTVSFAQAAQRTAIATGEKLSVLLSKIAKWLADLGSAAWKNATNTVTSGSSDLVESGAVYTAVSGKYTKPAGGIPKTDLAQAVQTSLGKADTALQSVPDTYRTAEAQDVIDAAKLPSTTKYAASQSVGGAADKAVSIPMGAVDSTSTATAFTATIDGITELRAGVCVWLTNGVVTSAAGCTLNINSLGAKPIYNSIAAQTATTTTFNINYTMLFIYNAARVAGGCWDMVYGYDANTTYTPVKLGFGYATCTTAAATAAKVASLSSYTLVTNSLVSVHFSNDVPAGATLNINSRGAKAIYNGGAAIEAGVIKGGDTVLFVFSTYYRLLSIDRWGTDIGKAYVKPASGIPASDLAAGVIPSVPSAYTGNPAALGTASPGSAASWARGDHVHPKPAPIDIGAEPATVVVTVTGTTPTITAEANHRYVCKEVATLDLTPPASGICDVIFTSGSTATVLTVPSTVRWANGFDPSALDANTTYELNIMDGLGVAVGVEVTA